MGSYYEEELYYKISQLRPQFREWVYEQIKSEDYYEGMDIEEAYEIACDRQQADEYYEDREQADEHYRQVAEAKRKELEKRFPGVVFPKCV